MKICNVKNKKKHFLFRRQHAKWTNRRTLTRIFRWTTNATHLRITPFAGITKQFYLPLRLCVLNIGNAVTIMDATTNGHRPLMLIGSPTTDIGVESALLQERYRIGFRLWTDSIPIFSPNDNYTTPYWGRNKVPLNIRTNYASAKPPQFRLIVILWPEIMERSFQLT